MVRDVVFLHSKYSRILSKLLKLIKMYQISSTSTTVVLIIIFHKRIKFELLVVLWFLSSISMHFTI